MINNILISDNALVSDLDKDFRDEYTSTAASDSSSSPLTLPFFLLKKHISIAPMVMTHRNTTNNRADPLVPPSCSDEK